MKNDHHEKSRTHYVRLAAMSVASFLAMYVLMYAMVDRFDNVYASFNQVYMAGLMTAPMVAIELALMGSMYPDRKVNAVILAVSVAALVLLWLAIRSQAAVGDRQFLRSMIPHHAGAILMCEKASISDAEVRKLCVGIIKGQQQEIDQMKAILARTR
jgi:uncharacterized protein (DUF305 family)